MILPEPITPVTFPLIYYLPTIRIPLCGCVKLFPVLAAHHPFLLLSLRMLIVLSPSLGQGAGATQNTPKYFAEKIIAPVYLTPLASLHPPRLHDAG